MHRITADMFDGFALVLESIRRFGYRKIAVAVDLLVAQTMQNHRGLPPIPRVVLVPGVWADGASASPADRRAQVARSVAAR